jgi:hypothetical protein
LKPRSGFGWFSLAAGLPLIKLKYDKDQQEVRRAAWRRRYDDERWKRFPTSSAFPYCNRADSMKRRVIQG